jgi:dihydropteroate synthase
MSWTPRALFNWQLRTRSLALGRRTRIMGILNVTPDSFSDGGLFYSPEDAPERAVAQALKMLEEGADVLDVGGESTRPNATPVSAEEEQARVLPVIEAILKERPETILSVDTFHADTARCAVGAGVEIVNDVSGHLWDAEMSSACAALGCGAVLMHTRGRPSEWVHLPPLAQEEVAPEVLSGLTRRLEIAVAAGMARERIVLDPGFGFGKRLDENYVLLGHLDLLRRFEMPLMVGVSRKGFLARTIASLGGGAQAAREGQVHATNAAQVTAILAGAHVVRTHEVRSAAQVAAVADDVLAAR